MLGRKPKATFAMAESKKKQVSDHKEKQPRVEETYIERRERRQRAEMRTPVRIAKAASAAATHRTQSFLVKFTREVLSRHLAREPSS